MIPKIMVNKSANVFSIFAALNLMGYDEENNPQGMSPERTRLREELLKYREEWTKKYPRLGTAIARYHPYTLLKSPPKYFRESLQSFSVEPLIKKIWQSYSSRQVKEGEKISASIKTEIEGLIKLLGNDANRIAEVEVTANLLDSYWRGYSFRIGDLVYLVVGPGATDNNSELIRHELLHSMVPDWKLPSQITKTSVHEQARTLGYGNQSALNNEYLVHGVNLIYREKILKENIEADTKELKTIFPNIDSAIEFIKRKIKKRPPAVSKETLSGRIE